MIFDRYSRRFYSDRLAGKDVEHPGPKQEYVAAALDKHMAKWHAMIGGEHYYRITEEAPDGE